MTRTLTRAVDREVEPAATGAAAVAAGYSLLALLAYVPLLLHDARQGRRRHQEYLYLDPGRLLSRAASMWDPNIGMGTVTHQNIGYLFPMGPYYWLLDTARRARLGRAAALARLDPVLRRRSACCTCCARSASAGPGVVVAALAYMFTPYTLDYAARISVMLHAVGRAAVADRAHAQGAARRRLALSRRSSRSSCRSIGGVNATALIFAGVGPVLWIVYAWLVEREVGPHPLDGPALRRRHRDRPLGQLASLGQAAVGLPEPPQVGDEPKRELGLAGVDAPVGRPLRRLASSVARRSSQTARVVVASWRLASAARARKASACRRRVTSASSPSPRAAPPRTDRTVSSRRNLTPGLVGIALDEALVRECGQVVEEVDGGRRRPRHDRGLLVREPALEDRQPFEDPLESGLEQVVAPRDGAVERPLASRCVARPAPGSGRCAAKSVADRRRAGAGRRAPPRARRPAAARRAGRRSRRRPARPRPGPSPGGPPGRARRTGATAACGSVRPSGATGILLLAGDMERARGSSR